MNNLGRGKYWEYYSYEYIKIIETGQIVRKENAKKFLKKALEEAFLKDL